MSPSFNSSFGLKLTSGQVVEQIINFIKADPKMAYKIIIGSDSLEYRDNHADFVTAIVVHRQGKGGRYFWRRIDGEKFYTIRDRIIHEVILSLDVAKMVLGKLRKEKIMGEWDFEIHVDIGENGPTRDLIQEVVGMIRANNFEAKTKPLGYAASKVADRHV